MKLNIVDENGQNLPHVFGFTEEKTKGLGLILLDECKADYKKFREGDENAYSLVNNIVEKCENIEEVVFCMSSLQLAVDAAKEIYRLERSRELLNSKIQAFEEREEDGREVKVIRLDMDHLPKDFLAALKNIITEADKKEEDAGDTVSEGQSTEGSPASTPAE